MTRKTLSRPVRNLFLGVREKLLLSYSLVAITTIAASSIGFYSFSKIEGSIGHITNDSVPSMITAMMLAQRSAALESAMPLLTLVKSDTERESLNRQLKQRAHVIATLGNTLSENSRLHLIVNKLNDGIETLDELTKSRLSSSMRLGSTMRQMLEVQSKLDRLLVTEIDDAGFELIISSEDMTAQNIANLESLASSSLVKLNAALNLKSEINALMLNFSIATATDDLDKVETLAKRAELISARIVEYQSQLGSQYSNAELLSASNTILAAAKGGSSIFRLRIAEFSEAAALAESAALLEYIIPKQKSLTEILTDITESVYAELVMSAKDVENTNAEGIPQLMDTGVSTLRALLEARAENNLILGMLSEASQVDSVELLQPIIERFNAAKQSMLVAQSGLQSLANKDQIVKKIEALFAFAQGERSIFSLRQSELKILSNINVQLDNQKQILAGLLDKINEEVDKSKQAVAIASENTSEIIKLSKTWLGVFALSSLVVSVLIVWLFVTRNLLARLMSVISALRNIANGNLDCEVKIQGRDELGELAESLEVFREKARENDRLQEAERKAAEERIEQERERQRFETEKQAARDEKHRQELERSKRESEQNEALKQDTDALLDVVRSAAQGDLTKSITVCGDHPTGQLAQGLEVLIESFTRVMNQIFSSAETVASGAREMANGNTHLSKRTEQQANSLEETSASVAQITETVKQNTENAQHANDLALKAQERAEQGSQVVAETVSAMGAINESSVKIAEIVGVIDEIAFQTNLLALNAAVEAARAGEQGRGFAVVASEVRNLAARSATAAKEIKELIEDSVDKVNHGVKLVGESGQTLDELLGSVKQVTDIVKDIVEGSEHQSNGIEKVNEAVILLDEMTQKNAQMVQMAASSSESMAEQSVKLKEHISFFNFKELDGPGDLSVHDVGSEPDEQQRLSA